MSLDSLGSLRAPPVVRPKVFVSYHHQQDQWYYDRFSETFHDTYESIYDNSLERAIDSENADYVMRRIRENYITGTSCTIVLVGAATWGRKYVDWEILATLEKEHGLIGVQLPTLPVAANGRVTVPDRLADNIQSGFAVWVPWVTFTANAGSLHQIVLDARGRAARLINNARARRLRNA